MFPFPGPIWEKAQNRKIYNINEGKRKKKTIKSSIHIMQDYLICCLKCRERGKQAPLPFLLLSFLFTPIIPFITLPQ